MRLVQKKSGAAAVAAVAAPDVCTVFSCDREIYLQGFDKSFTRAMICPVTFTFFWRVL
jgi:hypothetical protein